jgi:hypothetical protein
MKNDNFKNQVQDELAGLSFQPSEKVWPEVKRRLEKDKRRRGFIFFWVLLGGLLLSGGLITFINSGSKNSSTVTSAKQKSELEIQNELTQNTVANNNDSTITDINVPGDSSKKQNTVFYKEENEVAVVPLKKSVKTKSKTAIAIKAPALIKDDGGKDNVNVLKAQPVSDENESIIPGNTVELPIQKETSVVKIEPADTNEISVVKSRPDTVNKKDGDTGIVKSKSRVEKKKLKQPWVFGAELALGSGNIGKGFTLGVNGNSEKSLFDNGAYTAGPPSQVALPNVASAFKTGAAFNIGFIAERNISKRFSFVTGINYQYLSTSVLTGHSFDTVISSAAQGSRVYRQGFTKSYLNKFHFIALPAAVKVNLFAKNKFSANVNAGINIMQLLATNALLYDSSVRSYYSNKNIFNKTLVSVSAGMQLNYRLNNGFLIAAGPQFMHSVSPIGNGYNYSNRYFKIWAVKAKILLNKKNK